MGFVMILRERMEYYIKMVCPPGRAWKEKEDKNTIRG